MMHMWGDKGVDWEGINDAASFIDAYLRKRKVNVHQSKEKFGTVRVYCGLGLESFEQLVRPGYYYSYWPYWARWLDTSLAARWLRRALNYVVVPYHIRAYRRAYELAVAKWPHLHEEIVCAADFSRFLEGV